MSVVIDSKNITDIIELRRQAENQWNGNEIITKLRCSDEDASKLIQELEIHQIELEIQNIELRQSRDEIELLYSALAARTAELAMVNIELEAFNYTVSHDLRKPLTIIHSYCQVLRDYCKDRIDEESKEYIQEIYEAVLRMNRLISALIKFSHVAHCELCRERVDLSAMVKDIAAGIIQAEPERRIIFHNTEGVTAVGDATLWRIVMHNLIENSCKYSRNKEETVIEFGVESDGDTKKYYVRDNGSGFDMAHAGTLFIPFRRLPGSGATGNGIGLATVDRIVRRQGGRIWAESEPNKGATFYFTAASV